MGYQESFIYTGSQTIESNNKMINDLIKLFEKYDVRTFDDDNGQCVAKVRFLTPVESFKTGMEVLWITGERSCQRGPERLFDFDDLAVLYQSGKFTQKELNLINSVELCFLDYVSEYMRDITRKDSKIAKVEYLKLEAETSSKLEIVKELVNRIKPEQIVNDYLGYIFAVDPFEDLDQRIRDVCHELNLPLNLEITTNNSLYLPQYNYDINGSLIAIYHETPHLQSIGSWNFLTTAQKLRKHARAIEDFDKDLQITS